MRAVRRDALRTDEWGRDIWFWNVDQGFRGGGGGGEGGSGGMGS